MCLCVHAERYRGWWASAHSAAVQLACAVRGVGEDGRGTGWAWTRLGHTLLTMDHATHAEACFQQGAATDGKYRAAISEFDYLGPCR